jgi:putative acetyltransferase
MAPATTEVCLSGAPVEEARSLFEEYSGSLPFDLSFQDFTLELAKLPGEYQSPGGVLLLARVKGKAAGCVAMRKFADGVCEMKRLYVRPPYRGMGIGRLLSERVIQNAREGGYRTMLLDTIDSMTAAMQLYHSLGFQERPPYRHNPIPGARYFELGLT